MPNDPVPQCLCRKVYADWDIVRYELNAQCPIHGKGTTYWEEKMKALESNVKKLYENY